MTGILDFEIRRAESEGLGDLGELSDLNLVRFYRLELMAVESGEEVEIPSRVRKCLHNHGLTTRGSRGRGSQLVVTPYGLRLLAVVNT